MAAGHPARLPRRAWLVRIAGSVAFMLLALWGTGLGQVLDRLAGLSGSWLALALVALSASYVIAALRWRIVLRAVDVRVSAYTALRFSFIGLFFNNGLPTGLGGDAVRAWMMGVRTGRRAAVAASVLVDRLAAVWALVGLGLAALALRGGDVPGSVAVGMALATAAVVGGTVALLTPSAAARLARGLARWEPAAAAVLGVGESIGRYRSCRGVIALALALSLAAQLCVAFAAWTLARGLGLDVGPLLLAAVIPIALLATALPTSINGLGVREATFRALLVPAGVAPGDAVAFSLSTVLAAALVSLPGAIWFVMLRARAGAVFETAPHAEPAHPRLNT